jgi:uncharacterized membrane protein
MAKKNKRKHGRAASKTAQPASTAQTQAAPQRATPNRASAAPKPASKPKKGAPGIDWLQIVAILSAVGVCLAGYLAITKWTGTAPAMCAAEGGCDVVQSSRWAVLVGVPIAFWGALTYALVGAIAWRARRKPSQWKNALFFAFAGVSISIYLTIVSVVEIGALCGYCLGSLALIVTIFAILCAARPDGLSQTFRWPVWLTSSGMVVAALVLSLHLYWSGVFDPSAGPEKPYLRDLAVHLEESGAKFYGASWCPACQRQKALFEASSERLPFVECSPGGRGTSLSITCQDAGVENFPTWTIQQRNYVGVLPPARLATLSKFAGKQ